MLTFKGIQRLSLIDYPKKISAIVFLPSCNFNCPYCYNSSLVNNPDSLKSITKIEILDFLKTRQGKLDALVITGGEPTLHKDLLDFIKKVKELNFLIKLDTNGTNPKLLKELLKVIDYIAMDIKAPLEKYEKITNVKVNTKNIKQSIDLIKNSNGDYEFRTTVLPKFLKREDILEIASLLKGSKKYVLQQFHPFNGLIDESLKNEERYSEEELEKIKNEIKPYFKEIELRF